MWGGSGHFLLHQAGQEEQEEEEGVGGGGCDGGDDTASHLPTLTLSVQGRPSSVRVQRYLHLKGTTISLLTALAILSQKK